MENNVSLTDSPPDGSPIGAASAGDSQAMADCLALTASDSELSALSDSPAVPAGTDDVKAPAKKVAIVGMAPSSRGLAPFSDDSWEIWTLSTLMSAGGATRFDRHFEIHPVDWFKERDDKTYFQWLTTVRDKPVYLHEPHPDIPTSVAFPKSQMVREFGTYITNTVSWMLALAISELTPLIGTGDEQPELAVYGVDMAQDQPDALGGKGEYAAQRPSCEYFLGIAVGRGIKVTIPATSDLLASRGLYGYDTDSGQFREKWRSRTAELQQRLAGKQQEANRSMCESHYLQGALDSQQYYRQWTGEADQVES